MGEQEELPESHERMRWFRYRPAAGRVSLPSSHSRVHLDTFVLVAHSLLYHWPVAATSMFVGVTAALAALRLFRLRHRPAASHGVAATRLEPRTKREATANRLGTVMSLRAPFDPISAFISSTSLLTLRTLRASLRPLVIAIIIICTFARVHSTL